MSRMKKPYYSIEFKRDATQLVLNKGYRIQEAANSFGVSVSALRKWINAEKGSGKSNNHSSSTKLNLSEHEELVRLRKENSKHF